MPGPPEVTGPDPNLVADFIMVQLVAGAMDLTVEFTEGLCTILERFFADLKLIFIMDPIPSRVAESGVSFRVFSEGEDVTEELLDEVVEGVKESMTPEELKEIAAEEGEEEEEEDDDEDEDEEEEE
jgi:hypothetical protein